MLASKEEGSSFLSRELYKHLSIYSLGSAAQAAASFLLIPIYTFYLEAAEYGAYSLLLTVSTLTGAVFFFGVSSALPRSYYEYSMDDERAEVFSTALYLTVFGAVLQIVLGYFLASTISQILFSGKEYWQLIFWSLVNSAVLFVNTLFYVLLRLKRQSREVVLVSLVTIFINLVIVLYFLAILQLGIGGAVYAGLVAQLGLSCYFVLRFARKDIVLRFNMIESKQLLRFGGFSVLSSFAAYISQWAGQLIINSQFNLATVGMYSLAMRIATMLNVLLVTPFTQIWKPMMMEYRKSPNISMLFEKAILIYWLVGLTLILAFSYFGLELLSIISRDRNYLDGFPLVIWLMMAFLIYGFVNIVSAGFFYERKIEYMAAVNWIMAIASICTTWYAVANYGLYGSVIAFLIIYSVTPALVYFWSKRFYQISIPTMKLLKILGLFLLSSGIRMIDIELISVSTTLECLSLIVFVAVSYKIVVSNDY